MPPIDFEEFVRKIETSVTDSFGSGAKLYSLWELDYYKKLFFDDLGLIGGAYSVLEKFTNEPLLLFRKDFNHNPDVKDSDFFWFPYHAKYYNCEDAETIDRLFLTTREAQKLDQIGPDFIRYIRSASTYKFSLITNNNFKYDSLPIIYCDSVEILLILLCYLLLIEECIESNSGEMPVWPENSIEAITLNTDFPSDNIVRIILEKSKESSETVFDFFIKKMGVDEKNSILLKKMDERICKLGEVKSENIKSEIAKINRLFFGIPERCNYNDGIGKLHNLARFPIIPYLAIYYKIDKIPILPSHLVFPVWSSFSFRPDVRIDNKIESIETVIFALLTVDDRTYCENFAKIFPYLIAVINKLGHIVSDTIFYKKFAYKSVFREATKAALSQVFARNQSHNIGSHSLVKMSNANQINELLEMIEDEQRQQYQPFKFKND